MTLTLSFPAWLLWTLGLVVGVPLVLLILGLAWFGWVALTTLSSGVWK